MTRALLTEAGIPTRAAPTPGKPTVRRIRDGVRRLRRACVDTLGLMLTLPAALWLRHIRRTHSIQTIPRTRSLFSHLGVYPIFDHYYEPLIDRRRLGSRTVGARNLTGIEWGADRQWSLLEQFKWSDELLRLPSRHTGDEVRYYLHNGYFGPGDADLYYSLIRLLKPRRIVEVGSGHSTRLAVAALRENARETAYSGTMVCVEPYRHPDWFPRLGVEHHRTPIESVGDVLCLVQEILPAIPRGVFVHVHDIFSPLDYPAEWLVDRIALTSIWLEKL